MARFGGVQTFLLSEAEYYGGPGSGAGMTRKKKARIFQTLIMSSRPRSYVIPTAQPCHPDCTTMSSRLHNHVIPTAQSCHPGLDPGSPECGSSFFYC